MTTIQAIPTRYRGYHFRSRLEARWAVFFDHLCVEWVYEREGFNVNGTPYLPDFWLPEIGVWLEVKGERDEAAAELVKGLADVTGEAAVIWTGLPPDSQYGKIFCADATDGGGGETEWVCKFVRWQDGTVGLEVQNSRSDREFFSRGMQRPLPAVRIIGPHQLTSEAAFAARSARFEHGESGAT